MGLMGRMNFLSNAAPLGSKEGQLTLVALIMMLYVIAIFLAVAIHEVMGHGLATIFFGGEFYALYLSPGSGYVSFYLPDSISTLEVALIYMAGIAVQIFIGLIVLFFVFPRIKNFLLGIFTLLFSVAMLVHPSLYLFLGYFYQSGDTLYAVSMLQIQPDIFVVAGLIMTGFFTLLISTAALQFIGSFLDVGDEKVRNKILLIFWLPPLLLSGVSALISAFFTPANEVSYTLANAAIILLFLGMAIYLVPIFVEPERTREYRMSLKNVFSVLFIFIILLGVWIGAFGVSQDSAHGILLHEPPVGVEQYYADYTIGNAEIFIFSNGTARVDIILRNQLENPSPLNEKIYHTFDNRPEWDRYILRSQNIVITMFDLQREVGENLTFTTDYGTARALGVEDEWGRKCTTYLALAQMGTRQSAVPTNQDDIFQPTWNTEGADISISFKDPWKNRGGFLDEVRISWVPELEYVSALAFNDETPDIDFNRGNILDDTIGWKNIDSSSAPAEYKIILRNVG